MNKINLVYFITSLNIGGAEINLLNLCRKLKNDFKISVISIKKYGELKKYFEEINIPVYETGNSIFKYKKIIKELNPHIVHAFLPRACYISRLSKTKSDNYFLINSQRAFLQRTDIFEKCYEIMEKLSAKKTDLIVANSESVRERILSISDIPENKVITIYTGIDTDLFKTENFNDAFEKGNKSVIGTIGRLCSHKNYDTLLNASFIIKKEIKNFKLIFVGDGDMKNKLKKLSKKLKIEEYTEFMGKKENVTEFLKSFDVFVLPSISEGLPTALLEAMSMELPCVVSDISPHREIIDENKNGLFFKVKKHEELAEKILYLYRNTDKREILGLNARIKILEKFSFKNYIDRYKNLYIEIFKNL